MSKGYEVLLIELNGNVLNRRLPDLAPEVRLPPKMPRPIFRAFIGPDDLPPAEPALKPRVFRRELHPPPFGPAIYREVR